MTTIADDSARIDDDVGGLESAARTHPGEGHLPGFDGLRAMAALLVVVFHAASVSGLLGRSSAASLVGETNIGVSVFFVLSGFLLYRPFVAANLARRSRPRTGPYLRRRALRILPAYWLALTAIVFVFHREVINSFGDGVVFYGLFQIYSGRHIFGGLNQAWSLGTEVTFYLFLPVWAALLGRLGRRWERQATLEGYGLLLLVLIAFAWRTVLVQQHRQIGYAWLPAHLDTFALGMGLAVVGVRGAKGVLRALAARPWLCWGAAAALFVLLASLHLPQGLAPLTVGQRHIRHVIFELVAVLLVLPAALAPPTDRGAVHRFLASPVLGSIGLVSYGIFLWHQFWIGEAVRWTGGQELASKFWPVLVLALLCLIPTAAVSYVAVEQPIIAASKRLRRRPGRGAVIEGAVLVATGYALGRVLGAGVALAGMALARHRGPRSVALGAVVALVAAALLTVASAAPPVQFADRVRTDPVLASTAGLVAALLLVVAVVEFARVERRSGPDEDVGELARTSHPSLEPGPPVEEPIDVVSWTVDRSGTAAPTEPSDP